MCGGTQKTSGLLLWSLDQHHTPQPQPTFLLPSHQVWLSIYPSIHQSPTHLPTFVEEHTNELHVAGLDWLEQRRRSQPVVG